MIDTQAIRKKILDLALRGKLTEQLPEDGTAEELYGHIQQIKKQLESEKRIKSSDTLTDVSEVEIPYEIPANWKWLRWGNIVNVVSARRVHQSDWKEAGIPFYRAREIARLAENGYVHNDLFISEKLYEEFSASGVPHAGDLMVSAVGTLGKAYVVKESDKFYYKDASVICFENYAGLNPFYLSFIMQSDMMLQQIKSNSGGTTVDTLTMVRMVQYILPLPPMHEQQRIVDTVNSIISVLDTIDTLQSQYQDNLATLKSKIIDAGIQGKLTEQLPEDGTAEELYQQIQQEKLALEKAGKIKKSKPLPPISDEEKPFDIPESWKWVKLGNVITLVSGTDFKPEDYNDAGIGMPYMTGASNIENDKLIINRWTPCPKNIAHEGELLLVCKGSGFGKLVICNVSEAHIARQFMSIRPYRGVDVNYVKALMTNSFQIIKEAGKGLIPGVDRDTVLNIPLPLPPLAEQKRIVAKLEELLPLCEG